VELQRMKISLMLKKKNNIKNITWIRGETIQE
jgi:hypothetical protein